VTPIQLAAVCSIPIASVSTAGWIYTLRALRRSRNESAAQSSELADLREKDKQSEDEVAVVKRELANTQGKLKRFQDFIRRSTQRSAAQSRELSRVNSKLSKSENEVTEQRGKREQAENELAVVKPDLANTQAKLKRFRDFIDSLEPLLLQLARDAGDGRARSEFWRETALDFLAELKEQDAAEKTEAKLDFAFTAGDIAVSHGIPHPIPRGWA
jgi:chromosome segregation ATPase